MIEKAKINVKNILTKNLLVDENEFEGRGFLIVYDELSPISKILFKAYSELLPNATKVSFYDSDQEELKKLIRTFERGNTVILIQSSSFRMSNFRWRLELFNLGYKVIEHGHLASNLPTDEQTEIYIDTLEYRGEYYKRTADYLTELLEKSEVVKIVTSNGNELNYAGGMEEVKKNIGDYSKMVNTGSAFPIGEVFTEPKDIYNINGKFSVYAFADVNHRVVFLEKPFVIVAENGLLHLENEELVPVEFLEVMKILKSENEDGLVRMREIGFGLNTGISRTRKLNDISAYERVCGLHVSLGLKHDIYRKKVPESLNQRYHIDIFPDVQEIWIDNKLVFEGEKYLA